MNRRTVSLATVLVVIFASATDCHAQAQTAAVVRQQFVCNTGFGTEECHRVMVMLRRVLARYNAEQLGDWTWVVVRTEDWKKLMKARQFSVDAPAITYLPHRQTFFDEALFSKASLRTMELDATWNMSMEELLDKAVRHELAHALCGERSEVEAARIEDRLRIQSAPACGLPQKPRIEIAKR
jgi:hypothetical protein